MLEPEQQPKTIKTDSVIFDDKIYPRTSSDAKLIEKYMQSDMDKLPPIIIDRKKRLIDGYHRLLAFRRASLAEISYELFDSDNDTECLLEAIRLNATHGKQLTGTEKKNLSNQLWDILPPEEIQKLLSISHDTLYTFTREHRQALDDARDAKILDLYLRCWTQEEIAKEVGISEREVRYIIARIGKDSEIGKTASEAPETLQNTTLWQFDACDNSFGSKYPGRMPGQIVQNLLWYYTEPFDVVLDPFGGSGTTLDVCKSMYRRCAIFDIEPDEAKGIRKHNVLDGVPKLRIKDKPRLILLDPPYADQKEGDYPHVKGQLADLSHDKFKESIINILNDSANNLTDNGIVVLIVSASKKDNKVIDWTIEFAKGSNNLELVERIIVPYENASSMTGYWIENSKQNRWMLRAYRDLLVFRKVARVS